MDALSRCYYEEIGYDEEYARGLGRRDPLAAIEYRKPFEAYAVERLFAEHSGCVFDLGAGHSVYEDTGLFARVRRVLESYRNVILILPSPDLDESVRILRGRLGVEEGHWLDRLNEHSIRHCSNRDLAKITVYTEGKTLDQTCEEILGRVRVEPN
jgi:hypothetical protein